MAGDGWGWLGMAGDGWGWWGMVGDGGDGPIITMITYGKLATNSLVLNGKSRFAGDGGGWLGMVRDGPGWSGFETVVTGCCYGSRDRVGCG